MLTCSIKKADSLFYLRRVYFTLLEILIVISLVALIGGVAGVKVRGLILEQRFESEAAAVKDLLSLGEELMMVANADVYVLFKQEIPGGEVTLSMKVDQKLVGNWDFIVKKPPMILQNVKEIEFDEVPLFPSVSNEIQIRFLSRGMQMSHGVLRLATASRSHAGAKEKFIHINGYPHPLTFASSSETFGTLRHKGIVQSPEDEILIKATYDAIAEKKKESA